MNIGPNAADATELAQLLHLLRDWLATDHGELSESLERFIGSSAYGVETLRADLANIAFLLGAQVAAERKSPLRTRAGRP